MKTDNANKTENLGLAIDKVDDLAHALLIPMPDSFHVKCLKNSLPEVVKELKAAFAEATGENPWED